VVIQDKKIHRFQKRLLVSLKVHIKPQKKQTKNFQKTQKNRKINLEKPSKTHKKPA
jgi:hypothetical protein